MPNVQNHFSSSSFKPSPCDLTALNTLGLSSYTHSYLRLSSYSHLPLISEWAQRYSQLFVLGGGSNVILPREINALVVQPALRGIRLLQTEPESWIVEVAAGEVWHDFVLECLKQGWYGLENLALIPGLVGAAPIQNIGAYGVEVCEYLESVTAWHVRTRELKTLSAKECCFAYRDSRFKHDEPDSWIIVSVRFKLSRIWDPVLSYPDLQQRIKSTQGSFTALTAADVFNMVCAIRQEKLPDPKLIGNVGSFFKNPLISHSLYTQLVALFPDIKAYHQADGQIKIAAAWLIEQCGWKGKKLGRVGVHDHQALVLCNFGAACAQDILQLARAISYDVESHYGISLELEPRVIESRAH